MRYICNPSRTANGGPGERVCICSTARVSCGLCQKQTLHRPWVVPTAHWASPVGRARTVCLAGGCAVPRSWMLPGLSADRQLSPAPRPGPPGAARPLAGSNPPLGGEWPRLDKIARVSHGNAALGAPRRGNRWQIWSCAACTCARVQSRGAGVSGVPVCAHAHGRFVTVPCNTSNKTECPRPWEERSQNLFFLQSSSGKTHTDSSSQQVTRNTLPHTSSMNRRGVFQSPPACWKWAPLRGSGSAPGLQPSGARSGLPELQEALGRGRARGLHLSQLAREGPRALGKLTKSKPFSSTARKAVNKSPSVSCGSPGAATSLQLKKLK